MINRVGVGCQAGRLGWGLHMSKSPWNTLCLTLWQLLLPYVRCRRLLKHSLAGLWRFKTVAIFYIDPGTVLHRQNKVSSFYQHNQDNWLHHCLAFCCTFGYQYFRENMVSPSDKVLLYCSLNNLFICSFIPSFHCVYPEYKTV